jgi:hypothetical protein
MTFSPLDTVVLVHDPRQHGLRTGDVGAVVEVYGGSTLEPEFVRPSGGTQALVTLERSDVRSINRTDVAADITPPEERSARSRPHADWVTARVLRDTFSFRNERETDAADLP